MKLSQSDIWNVTFEKENGAVFDFPITISNGVGDQVSFKIEDVGRYNIYSGGVLVKSQIVEKKGIINWVENNWGWIVLVAVVIILFYFIFKRKGGEEEPTSDLGY